MIAFKEKGHQVYLMGWEKKGAIHENVEAHGVQTFTFNPTKRNAFTYYLNHFLHLTRFIKKEGIDLVYSHTQPVNFVAAFVQYFVKAKIILCRHHSNSMVITQNRNGLLFDKVINCLGKYFIVPSIKVLEQMRDAEGVTKKEIRLIRYAYDFSKYADPNPEAVAEIRNVYSAELLLVKVARFISNKRHSILFEQLKLLAADGLDIKLLVLSEGPLENQLKQQIEELGLESHVFFIGFTTKVIDYLAAADMVIHLSDSEASNSLIKEAGLQEKIVAVCQDVGDFDEYINHEVNGFKMPKDDPSKAVNDIIRKVYANKSQYAYLGKTLKQDVLTRFSVEHLIDQYDEVK